MSPTVTKSESPTPECLSRYVTTREGRLAFTIPDGLLPGFLIEAFNATLPGVGDKSFTGFSEQQIGVVHGMAQTRVPGWMGATLLLAIVLQRLGRFDEARVRYELLLKEEAHPLLLNEMAQIHLDQQQPTQAFALRQQALTLDPYNSLLAGRCAADAIEAGQIQAALTCLEDLIAQHRADRLQFSNYLFISHYRNRLDREELFRNHQVWARRFVPEKDGYDFSPRDNDPTCRLRIGYVSPNFFAHSVAYFFEPLLANHDPAAVETFGYGQGGGHDTMGQRLIQRFDHYLETTSLDDEALAERIRADGIDILVDLAGHTTGNRLGVFALKPAPIQITAIGYADTTGLAQMDYRWTDAWADTSDAQTYHTEQLWRLDTGFNCYQAPDEAPAVGPLPVLSQGLVTFGSFNNHAKITDTTLALWCTILRELPEARLLLKFKGGGDPVLCEQYRAKLQAGGVAPERVTFVGVLPVAEHFGLYNRVDIALDTFPYNGTTTTCEALWMGVPVVTLVGEHHASRVGLSLLTRLGLEVFAAPTPEDYVKKGCSLAGATETLTKLRASLRQRMQNSPLMDGVAYARAVERGYREMWKRWRLTIEY